MASGKSASSSVRLSATLSAAVAGVVTALDVMNAKAGERAQLLLELAQGLYKEVQSQAGTSAGEVESEGEGGGGDDKSISYAVGTADVGAGL